jgi:hypothetical protein
MDLIDKITGILKSIELTEPIIDIHYDNQKHIVGHITDEKFSSMSDSAAQELIWEALKKNLDAIELKDIIAIFHETPFERVQRINGYRTKEISHSNFWFHKTPDLAIYWLFIDVAKFGDDYKSFFLIINEKNKISKGLTFVYDKDVLEFMELEQNEIHNELYSNTFQNAEAEIKMDLMNHYESLTSQQLYGKANMYYYVYENFQLTPAAKKQLRFTDNEIIKIKAALTNIKDDFAIKTEIEKAINYSTAFNKLKGNIG